MKTTNENWYEFTAYNTGDVYGYGSEEEAEKYCDLLNKDREINVYGYAVAEGKDSDYCDEWNNLEDNLAED